MGDLPKPPDDATWTEVERDFFAAAPPEEPQPVGEAPRFDDLPALPPQRPRRELMAWLRPSVAAAWRRTALIVGVAGAGARRAARAVAAGLVAALSIFRVDRRRVGFALAGAIVVAGLTAGGVAFRKNALTKSVTAEMKAPLSGPTVAEAAPVATAAPPAAPPPPARSSADVQAPRADVSTRRPHAHRRSVPTSSSAQRPVENPFMDRETYWAREARPAPDRSSRSLFSR